MNMDFFKIKETMLKSALWYQEQGFSVIPIVWNAKNASIPWKNLILDKESIIKYWNSDLKNIAIMTGKRSSKTINGIKYKLICIDEDNKHQHDGQNSLNDWQTKNGLFPKTCLEETPNGGRHHYFLIPFDMEVKNQVNVLDGIDIRSDDGYIVASPSQLIVDGIPKPYKWIVSPTEYDVAIANESVLKLLQLAESMKKPSNLAESDGKEQTQRPGENLKIKQGERVQFLVKMVAQQDFKSNLLGIEDIKNLIRLINKNRLDPPLREKELEKEVFPSIERFELYTQSKVIFDKSMLVSMDEVEEQEIEWLVPKWIPKSTITIMGGDGGVGKTTLWCSIVANLTNGMPTIFEDPSLFEGREPQKILFFSSEDDLNRVIKRRLNKNGANMKMVKTIPMTNDAFMKLTFDSDLLEQMIQVEKPSLCVFDPIQSFVGGDTDMNKRNQMRIQMNYLIQLGERYNTAFLVVMHTNKRASVSGRTRFAESSDIYDISRSAILIGNTKNKQIKYIDNAKNNYASLQKTILFSIDDEKPMFNGTTDKKDLDFINEKSNVKNNSQITEAKDYIIYYLRTNGSSNWKSLKEEAKDIEDISDRTMQRAKKELSDSKSIIQKRISKGKNKGVELIIEINYDNQKQLAK